MMSMAEHEQITLTLNGREQRVKQGTSLLALVESLGVDAGRVVVERNLEIVPAQDLDKTAVCAGDRIEVIYFVGGG